MQQKQNDIKIDFKWITNRIEIDIEYNIIENDDTVYNAISSDVAQCSFNKCTAKQISFESGFKYG